MAMTKAQYALQGETAARRGEKPSALSLHPGSWQHAAYMGAYEREIERLQAAQGRVRDARLGVASPPAEKRAKTPGIPLAVDSRETLGAQALAADLLEQRRRERFAHWPGAAAEHLRQISLDAAQETDPVRVEHLMRSAARLVKRHGPTQEPTTGA